MIRFNVIKQAESEDGRKNLRRLGVYNTREEAINSIMNYIHHHQNINCKETTYRVFPTIKLDKDHGEKIRIDVNTYDRDGNVEWSIKWTFKIFYLEIKEV